MTWSQLKTLLKTAKVLHDGRGGFAFSSAGPAREPGGKS